jgi:hypothetical protein
VGLSVCQQTTQQTTQQTGADAAPAQPDLHQVVEHPLVAGGGPEPGVDDRRHLADPGRHRGVPQVPGQQRLHRPSVGRPDVRAVLADRRLSGQDAGRDRVVDPFAGHRVHQPRGVPDEQDTSVRMLPPEVRQRQVVAPPVPALRDRTGQQLLELSQQHLARGRGTSAEQLAVPDVGQPVSAVEGPGVGRLAA